MVSSDCILHGCDSVRKRTKMPITNKTMGVDLSPSEYDLNREARHRCGHSVAFCAAVFAHVGSTQYHTCATRKSPSLVRIVGKPDMCAEQHTVQGGLKSLCSAQMRGAISKSGVRSLAGRRDGKV